MAGLDHFGIHQDPAMLRLEQMRKTRYRYFRLTSRAARISFMYIVVVPFSLGLLAYNTDGKYNFRAKRKGDLILER